MRERRYSQAATAARLENRAEGLPTITGLAAVYYDGSPGTEYCLWDDGEVRIVERILPGTFDAAAASDDVRALFNHDPNQLLGRTAAGTLRLELRGEGLGYVIDPPDTPAARTVIEAVRRGDLTGSSFSFDVTAQRWDERQAEGGRVEIVREVLGVRLYDVGPVTFPAYSGTSAQARYDVGAEEAVKAILEGRRKRSASLAGILARARAVSLDD